MSLADMIKSKAAAAMAKPSVNQATGMGAGVSVDALINAALAPSADTDEFDAPADIVNHALAGKPSDSAIAEDVAVSAHEMAPPIGVDHPPLSFTCIQLQRLVKANGSIKLPHPDGYFIPEDEEELKMLVHMAEHGAGLVRFNPPAETSVK